MITLAADELVMDCNAVLGPVDPQVGQFPASSILNTVKQKNINRVDDNTLIMADVAEKAIKQVEEFLILLMADKFPPEQVKTLAHTLSEGKWSHDYPITCDKLKAFGLAVNVDFPTSLYTLMDLYPQPIQRRPSVQYIPLPYDKDTFKKLP